MIRATPVPDSLTEPFWAAARRCELVAQQCPGCGHRQHPPRPACGACAAVEPPFATVSGFGTVLSWSEVRHPFIARWTHDVPFTCFLVELDEQEGLVFASDDFHFFRRRGRCLKPVAGMPVRVDFEPIDGGFLLPQFVPVTRG